MNSADLTGQSEVLQKGWLVLIVGPSGSGKDSVINWLKSALDSRSDIMFVRRTVTRNSDGISEDHDSLSPAEFQKAQKEGDFAVTWPAHGLSYGLPRTVQTHLRDGGVAIANGSRKALPFIKQNFSKVYVVCLQVEKDVLIQRLSDRGRETSKEITARLERMEQFMEPGQNILMVDNSGPLDEAGSRILKLIEDISII
ncbi:MAG: phosphonate metabolism protein/1,5-bisphosphokinase (PRPP-forming) PhnN [Cohaesibacteraceae bacterium]|nr:phosphonate metabolism protein/1,5-bisphosphokinase (PRPP-forming) PhnN [Cohaesibacteraceae bacterium]MBL4875227.1 phosphonate metabolism protein/1,5-bisphosphokinase (PRPP-forming) PhnN [Cohaesibacteraceae bacterium]